MSIPNYQYIFRVVGGHIPERRMKPGRLVFFYEWVHPNKAHPDPGWYFWNEDDEAEGPFPGVSAVEEAFKVYCNKAPVAGAAGT